MSFEFQTTVEQICIIENNKWATGVKGVIEFDRDLHVVDAIYHNSDPAAQTSKDAFEGQTLQAKQKLLQKLRIDLKQSRTSPIWLCFLDMMAI